MIGAKTASFVATLVTYVQAGFEKYEESAAKHGYVVEEHVATTEDGYSLTLIRVNVASDDRETEVDSF